MCSRSNLVLYTIMYHRVWKYIKIFLMPVWQISKEKLPSVYYRPSINRNQTQILQWFFFFIPIIGQERVSSLTRVYYKDAAACVIMFDITQRKSFDNVMNWKNDVEKKVTLSNGRPIPCLLLANKVQSASCKTTNSRCM